MKLSLLSRGLIVCIVAAAGAAIMLTSTYRSSHQIPNIVQQSFELKRTPIGMVYVPGSYCIIGSNDADADDDVKPAHRQFVPSFYIDRTEVTNTEFRKFRSDFEFPASEANLPATNITKSEAQAYCMWAGKRLPTNDEWEKAARGTDGRRYPWGDVWNANFVAKRGGAGSKFPLQLTRTKPGQCALGAARVQKVGSIPASLSPYGCVDMAGNAWEWVSNLYNDNLQQSILRGGAVGYTERSMRTYNRAIEGSGDT